MTDLKWDRLIDLVRIPYENIRINSDEIKPVFSSFAWNLQRTREMILSLSQVGHVGQRMQWCFDQALLETTGSIVPPDDPSEAMKLAGVKLRAEFDKDQELFASGRPEWAQRFAILVDNGTRCVEVLASGGGQRALGGILVSCIISEWTAFEIMASDLWEAAINAHPEGLSELKGTKKPKTTSRDDLDLKDRPDRREGKSIGLDWLHRYHYDLRGRMGTALRSRQRFDHLAGIREAYLLAFHRSSDRIEEILNDSALDALNSVRNVLVHRSGIVDSEYGRRTKYLPIPSAAIGTRIYLDGDIVYNLVAPVSQASIDLMTAVDHWIMTE
jgi:hypothetical protein